MAEQERATQDRPKSLDIERGGNENGKSRRARIPRYQSQKKSSRTQGKITSIAGRRKPGRTLHALSLRCHHDPEQNHHSRPTPNGAGFGSGTNYNRTTSTMQNTSTQQQSEIAVR